MPSEPAKTFLVAPIAASQAAANKIALRTSAKD